MRTKPEAQTRSQCLKHAGTDIQNPQQTGQPPFSIRAFLNSKYSLKRQRCLMSSQSYIFRCKQPRHCCHVNAKLALATVCVVSHARTVAASNLQQCINASVHHGTATNNLHLQLTATERKPQSRPRCHQAKKQNKKQENKLVSAFAQKQVLLSLTNSLTTSQVSCLKAVLLVGADAKLSPRRHTIHHCGCVTLSTRAVLRGGR